MTSTSTIASASELGFELHDERPLRDPVLILAYAGWSDGGDAATTAIQYLRETSQPTLYARMDCESYFDFTVVRPQIRATAADERQIVWPDQELLLCPASDARPCDLLLSIGEEPHLRWRSYARSLAGFLKQLGVRRVLSLGAYLADVIYSQPTRVVMTSTDPEWVERHELRAPRYEGSTGILTVLAEALKSEGVPAATLWAPIPHYISARPNPRGALALLERVEQVMELDLELARLREMAATFDDEVSQAVAEDPELAAYVRELKRRAFSS